MASYDNAYSRVVASLKVLLPIVALGLLSTLFLLSRSIDPDRAIPYADVDVEELAREQRITGPTYSGMTDDGTSFTVSANRAQPDLGNLNRMTATDLSAELELETGTWIKIEAAHGLIDTGESRALLEGGVNIRTSDGYTLTTEVLEANLEATRLRADQPVVAESPLGRLEAGQLEVTRPEPNSQGFVLVFKRQVKLLYQPPLEDGVRE